MAVERFVYDSTPAKRAEIKRMSEQPSPESVGVARTTLQPAEMASDQTEFDLGYYGWRVVLAACLGRDGGIRLAVRLYLLCFCETAGCAIRLESRSHLERLRNRRRYAGGVLPAARPLDRSPWPSPHHSYLHDDLRMRHWLVLAVALRIVAVLRDLLRVGCSGERCSSSGLFAFHFYVVSTTFGDRAGLCDGWSGLGRHDFTRHRPIDHQPVRMARSLCVTRWSGIVTRLAPQLALHPRARRSRARVLSRSTFWNDMAAGPALFCVSGLSPPSFS